MYLPAAFALTDPQDLHRILREHPLGILVTPGPEGLDANHIPFEFDPDTGALGSLRAHVARANPVWQQAPSGSEVLVVFRGEQAYVSPNGYPGKHEARRQVPTWNYEAPADYLSQMMGQIVGIEIAITSLVGKSKMSQNKEARDRDGVAQAYEARGRDALAQRVRKGG